MGVSAQWTKSSWNWKGSCWSQEFLNLVENPYSHLSDLFIYLFYFLFISVWILYFFAIVKSNNISVSNFKRGPSVDKQALFRI